MAIKKAPNIPESLRNLCKELERTLQARPGKEWRRRANEPSHHYVNRILVQSKSPRALPGGTLAPGQSAVFELREPAGEEKAMALADAYADLFINWKTLPLQNVMEHETYAWSQGILAVRGALLATRRAAEKTANPASLAQRLSLIAEIQPLLERLEEIFPEEQWPSKGLINEDPVDSLRTIFRSIQDTLLEHFDVPQVAELLDDGMGGTPRQAQDRLRKRLDRDADKENSGRPHPRRLWVVPLDDQDPCRPTSRSARSPMN